MPLNTWNVVLVEDSLDLCLGWSELLALDGHQVRYFLTAREALNEVQALQEADVLVSDYYLPDLNGVEFLLRAREIRSTLPTILLTGAKDAQVRESLSRVPGALLLNKPLGVEALEESIRGLLDARRA